MREVREVRATAVLVLAGADGNGMDGRGRGRGLGGVVRACLTWSASVWEGTVHGRAVRIIFLFDVPRWG